MVKILSFYGYDYLIIKKKNTNQIKNSIIIYFHLLRPNYISHSEYLNDTS